MILHPPYLRHARRRGRFSPFRHDAMLQRAGDNLTAFDFPPSTFSILRHPDRKGISYNLLKEATYEICEGILVDSLFGLIRRNEVRSNIFNSYGGGIFLGNTVASFIEENVISDNTDRAGSSGRGAGISFEDSRAIAFGNIITSNRCNGEGDGVYIRGNSHVPSLGNRLVSPGGNNCIFLNADSDLLYSGTIPGEVSAQNNYWGSADRRLIASRIRGITPSRWNPIVASCRQTESSLRLRCYGHDCTLTPDAFRGCLTPAR